MFKILSVRKALSIQAHPDKALAAKLHGDFPAMYKDPNHKPEIAIALTDFEALCGFRPVAEILGLARQYPEFASLVSEAAIQGLQQAKGEEDTVRAMKVFFSELMEVGSDLVKIKTDLLLQRFAPPQTPLEELFLRLNKEYPGEVGCFCIFVMNFVAMKPGECIFMAANEPHAYLRGECVECMALSDNVVRAGLTPKFRDIDTLCSMLTYKRYTAQEIFTQPQALGKHSTIYTAPVSEFAVVKTALTSTGQCDSIERASDTILLAIKGGFTITAGSTTADYSAGKILLLPGKTRFEIQSTSEDVLLFQAFEPI